MKPFIAIPPAALLTVIGMLHCPALPGAPRYGGDLQAVREAVLRDAGALADGGVHGLMIENFHDVPFFPGRVPAETVAHLTALACEVTRRWPQLPLGINMLRNDGVSALAVAHASGAAYVRVNVLCGARVADQGVLQGIAHELLRLRKSLGAEGIRIMADVDVKHSAPLAARPLADEIDDTVHRGLADALVVSGAGTGKATDVEKVKAFAAAAGDVPVFVGSGVTAATVGAYRPYVAGVIVGSALKAGDVAAPVDAAKVRDFMRAAGV